MTAERDQKQDAYRQAAKRAKVQAGKLTEVRRDEARKHQERLERHVAKLTAEQEAERAALLQRAAAHLQLSERHADEWARNARRLHTHPCSV